MHVADVRIPDGDPRAGAPFPIVAFAVTHRDGVFLFDTGIGTGNAEVQEIFEPRTTPIEEALAAVGIEMADVTGVANCHLHFDHSGQNARFPGVPIFAQEREWRMVHEPDYTIAEWIDVPGLTYEFLDGEAEVAPGIRLLPTPGHTAGHQSLDRRDGARGPSSSRDRRSRRARNGWASPTRRPRASRARPIRRPTPGRSGSCARSIRCACTSPTTRRSGSADRPDPSLLAAGAMRWPPGSCISTSVPSSR